MGPILEPKSQRIDADEDEDEDDDDDDDEDDGSHDDDDDPPSSTARTVVIRRLHTWQNIPNCNPMTPSKK